MPNIETPNDALIEPKVLNSFLWLLSLVNVVLRNILKTLHGMYATHVVIEFVHFV